MDKSVLSGGEEGRGAAQERRGERPSGGLHVRARREAAKIVNGEKISGLNPLVHQYVSGIVPGEVVTILGDGTQSRYHIGVRRDRDRAQGRQS